MDNINDPYSKLHVPDVLKKINFKAFNLMSKPNETRHIKWHVACKCKCRLDASVCIINYLGIMINTRCECKKLIDKGVFDKEFIWNLSNCKCECDKLYDVVNAEKD